MKNNLLSFLTLHLGLAAVVAQPVITNQPASQTNLVGGIVTLTVGASGTPPLLYQWRRSGTSVGGETNVALVITSLQNSNAGNYTVVVTNVEGSVTSAVAFVRILLPPVISSQPTNWTGEVGESVTLTVAATGTAPLAYQWRLDGNPLLDRTNTSLVLTNSQLTNAGGYSVQITNRGGSITSRVAAVTISPVNFTKITDGVVSGFGTGLGCAWGDYDNDGFIDLIVTSASLPNSTTGQPNLLFHNNRNGTFTQVTNSGATAEGRDWRTVTWADYDNDGFLDLFFSSNDSNGVPGEDELFHNNGDGTFTKVARETFAGLDSAPGIYSEASIWADYDRDGFVDLFIGRIGSDLLFHNNGDGTFTRVTNRMAGLVEDNRDSHMAMWGDFNNDGWPDLFVPVHDDSFQNQTNFLYQNLGNGTFSRVISGRIGTDNDYSFGCAWGDYDNDGFLDLFVTSAPFALGTNTLYHNNGDGTFTRMASNQVGSIASDVGRFGSCAWGDYDNDGFLDLFVGVSSRNGVIAPNLLYHNNGDGTFIRILSGALIRDIGAAAGCAWGDYDNDGFLDLIVVRGTHFSVESRLLYRNNGNNNHWLKVRLNGTVSNRSAIGAKVRVRAQVQGKAMWQLREINTGNGFNADQLDPNFGLGDATNVDLVRIEWPSGIVQTLTNVAAQKSLTITEPARLFGHGANGATEFSIKGGRGFRYEIESSSDLATWTSNSTATITNLRGTSQIIDGNAGEEGRRFYRAVLR